MTQQQYTPVSWQDETTSQQGTLINAERLNQMQTAHHFADGLEETDTVPTADPGVAYHKIVYCTADNTLYRWDGTQWTADIDDPTRELLEEHEADHDNPHQVTKAQVGLGNADNTADLDKPISTATQTALNAKADKSDTYTKAQVDTALATKADKATTYTKTETDTLLGAKADKSTTYTKTEVDTLLAGKADTATTLAGYGITDAYTKTETDTLLGAKADDNAVVKLTGNQDIADIKTVVTQATGQYSQQIANSQKVKDELDNYAFMVRTVNNQYGIQGVKEFNIRPYAKINVSKELTASPSEDTFVKLYEIATGGSPRIIHGYIKSMWFIQYRFEIEFWIGGFNATSTFLLCRSLGQNNDNIRVTRDSSNKWAIWFKYPSGSGTTNRAFTEIIDQFYSYYYGTDLITVIPPDNQVFVPASSADWSNYTIINATEII